MSAFLAISGVEMDPKYKGTLCDANEVCMHIIASISEEKLLKHETFMISLFEPVITKIELSKAQKIHRQSYPQEGTLYPVPVFEGRFLVVSDPQ